jgi:uncharacterized protein
MVTSHSPAGSPFVVSVRDLVRRPGSRTALSLAIPAPEYFGTDVIGVPEGSDLQLELSLESVSEGIWISGTIAARAVGECSRCLVEVSEEIVAPVQGLFAHPGTESAGEGDDVDVRDFDGESLDIEELLRDAVVTSLPFVPLCDPDCPGLCDQCGALLAEDPDHHHDVVDPRWAALEDLTDTKET